MMIDRQEFWIAFHQETPDLSCPCCDRAVNFTPRHLNKEMMQFLDGLAAMDTGEFVQSRAFLPSGTKASSDGSYLVHWGMVERKKPGWYRLTATGRSFLAGQITTVSYGIFVWGDCTRWSSTMITADEARRVTKHPEKGTP